MKRFLAVFLWFFVTTALIFTSSMTFLMSKQFPTFFAGKEVKSQAIIAGKSVVSNKQDFNYLVEGTDARPQIIANFLSRYNSPMKPHDEYGKKIVAIADHYAIDFRLLPAIAMQESNLCKATNPNAPHNCLGFGIHQGGTLDFESYEDGFDRAARELKTFYIDRGLSTVEEIERKYTPSSNGSWANSVNQWMAEMRFDDRQMGREQKANTDASEFAKTPDSSL